MKNITKAKCCKNCTHAYRKVVTTSFDEYSHSQASVLLLCSFRTNEASLKKLNKDDPKITRRRVDEGDVCKNFKLRQALTKH